MRRYLIEVADALRGPAAEAETSDETSSSSAKAHGKQRWYEGYDLKTVILEYAIFRKAILDVVRAGTGAAAAISFDESEPLARVFALAMADAAVEFMNRSTTELKQAVARAERATEMSEDLLSVVSHDLKNPLAVVQGTVSILSRELDDPTHPLDDAKKRALRQQVERIRRAAKTMDRLIHQLLELGRLRAGETQLHMERHRVDELLNDACEAARPLAELRQLDLACAANLHGEAEHLRLMCDRDRILQVLANLVSNAIKFSPEGSTIALGASFSATPSGSVFTFEVEDSGPGIEPERLPRIFDRWQTPDTKTRGSGLGLSIAKGLIELHGGRIWVESRLGEGSSFLFALPQDGHRPSTSQ